MRDWSSSSSVCSIALVASLLVPSFASIVIPIVFAQFPFETKERTRKITHFCFWLPTRCWVEEMSRRLQRTIGYCLIGLSLLFLRDLIRLSSQFHPFPSSPPSPLSAPLRLNNAWGSILHRFENHPTSATARNRLPWTTGARERREVGNGAVRTWIVTGELEGLHSNGGIGTALRELAVSLAGEQGFEISILVAHPSTMFTVLQRTTVEAR